MDEFVFTFVVVAGCVAVVLLGELFIAVRRGGRR